MRVSEGTYETLLFEKHANKVALVTINRPEAFNSFNLKMVGEFERLWREIAEDEEINAVVVRASPGRSFSPGVDVRSGENIQRSENLWNRTDPGEGLGPKFNRCWKPIVCAVHGMCAGGGFYWVNESDLVICSEDATFFDPHVSYGMTAALEPIGLTYRIPLGDVMRMALLGNDERIGAHTALRIGLVTEVLPLDQLWDRAYALATKIAAKPGVATQGTVKAIWQSLDLPRSVALANGLVFPLLGNPEGKAQVDRTAVMSKAKDFEVR
jgi:enoyl-CoA hydratase/carnithine racemase